MVIKEEITPKELRSFGFMVGGIFTAIGIWPLIVHGEDARWWALVLAAFLILPAGIFPVALVWPYKGWMLIGHVLGWINTRIILGFVFYVVVTPIGLYRRLLGKDPMGRQLRPELDSYRVVRNPRRSSHLTKQY
jgi:hypothetical protein